MVGQSKIMFDAGNAGDIEKARFRYGQVRGKYVIFDREPRPAAVLRCKGMLPNGGQETGATAMQNLRIIHQEMQAAPCINAASPEEMTAR